MFESGRRRISGLIRFAQVYQNGMQFVMMIIARLLLLMIKEASISGLFRAVGSGYWGALMLGLCVATWVQAEEVVVSKKTTIQSISSTLRIQDVLANHTLYGLKNLGSNRPQFAASGTHPLILQFWASWCHSCGSLMWDLDELATRYSGTQYFSISIDDNENDAMNAIKNHPVFKQQRARYLLDQGDQLQTVLSVVSVPTIFVFNGKGTLVHKHVGHLNASDQRQIAVKLNELSAQSE